MVSRRSCRHARARAHTRTQSKHRRSTTLLHRTCVLQCARARCRAAAASASLMLLSQTVSSAASDTRAGSRPSCSRPSLLAHALSYVCIDTVFGLAGLRPAPLVQSRQGPHYQRPERRLTVQCRSAAPRRWLALGSIRTQSCRSARCGFRLSVGSVSCAALCRNKGFAFCEYVDPQCTPDWPQPLHSVSAPAGFGKGLRHFLQSPCRMAVGRVCVCVGGGGPGLSVRSDRACGDWPRQPARRTWQESAHHARARRSALYCGRVQRVATCCNIARHARTRRPALCCAPSRAEPSRAEPSRAALSTGGHSIPPDPQAKEARELAVQLARNPPPPPPAAAAPAAEAAVAAASSAPAAPE
jgi:hypothetical protein